MDRTRLRSWWYWRVIGRPPHMLATHRARRIGVVAALVCFGSAIAAAVVVWPNWSVVPLGLFALAQLGQLVVLAAEYSWAHRFGYPQWQGDTSVFTREAALEREDDVLTGRVRIYGYDVPRQLH